MLHIICSVDDSMAAPLEGLDGEVVKASSTAQDGTSEQSPQRSKICPLRNGCMHGMPRTILLCLVFVSLFSLSIWATCSGRLEDAVKSISDLHYAIVFSIIAGLMICVNLPCGWGHTVIIAAAGFGISWRALPPVWIGGVLLGPSLAYFVNREIVFRKETPEQIFKRVPHARARRMMQAIAIGIKEDKCHVLIVAATRASPLFVCMQNLVLSAAQLPFWSFVVGTILGGSPDVALITYLGILLRKTTEEASSRQDTVKIVSFILQVMACVLVTSIISCAAKRALGKYKPDEGQPKMEVEPCQSNPDVEDPLDMVGRTGAMSYQTTVVRGIVQL